MCQAGPRVDHLSVHKSRRYSHLWRSDLLGCLVMKNLDHPKKETTDWKSVFLIIIHPNYSKTSFPVTYILAVLRLLSCFPSVGKETKFDVRTRWFTSMGTFPLSDFVISELWPSCQKGVHLLHQSSTPAARSINLILGAWRVIISLKRRQGGLWITCYCQIISFFLD